jgi:hypothetical protein
MTLCYLHLLCAGNHGRTCPHRTNSESLSLAIIIPMIFYILLMVNFTTYTQVDTLFYSICLCGIGLKPHIYTVSITYFVLRFCERFFNTRSITYVTGINIYIYARTCVQDGVKICRNLFMDLLTHGKNGYRRFLLAERYIQ